MSQTKLKLSKRTWVFGTVEIWYDSSIKDVMFHLYEWTPRFWRSPAVEWGRKQVVLVCPNWFLVWIQWFDVSGIMSSSHIILVFEILKRFCPTHVVMMCHETIYSPTKKNGSRLQQCGGSRFIILWAATEEVTVNSKSIDHWTKINQCFVITYSCYLTLLESKLDSQSCWHLLFTAIDVFILYVFVA